MTLNSGADTRKITLGRVILGVLGAGIVFFAAIQLVPVKRDNPPVVSEPNWDSPQTRALAQRACFDCHSNETVWPWYAHVAPASWLAAHDVHEGRGILNFSDWDHPQPGPASRSRSRFASLEVRKKGAIPGAPSSIFPLTGCPVNFNRFHQWNA
jgi:hypothetical protein